MRVAMFVDVFPAISETFILKQITGLIDLGHEVDIFAQTRLANGNPIQPEVTEYRLLDRTIFIDMPPETGYWELPAYPILGKTWPPGSERPILNAVRFLRAVPKLCRSFIVAPRVTVKVLSPSDYRYQARSLSALYRLSALCSHSRTYDVIHAQFGTLGNNFRFAKEIWKAPLIVSFRGYDFSTVPRSDGPDVYNRLFQTVDAVTVNSGFTRGRLVELGCPPFKLHKLVTGCYLDDFPFRERQCKFGERVRLLTVARLVEKKGVEYSIRAVARARLKCPEIHYDVVGDGPLRPHLDQVIRELGLDDVVTLHGAQNRSYVREMMAAAHVFVLASVTATNGDQEGQGGVLQDAQAAGLPVVATDHNGFPESIVPGESGFLVPERDVEHLADRLIYLIENPDIWPHMGQRGRRHVEQNYDIRKVNVQLVDLYKELIRTNNMSRKQPHGVVHDS